MVRLGHVIDADNRTNAVNYLADDTYYKNRVGSIADLYGRTASFGRTGYSQGADRLTNIVDVAGLSSAFTYDGAGWPLTLTTPYGQTGFAVTSGTWPPTWAGPSSSPNRAEAVRRMPSSSMRRAGAGAVHPRLRFKSGAHQYPRWDAGHRARPTQQLLLEPPTIGRVAC